MFAHMTRQELTNFIAKKMKMSHVYQPLLIKTIVEAGGVATLNQVARAFAAADESQVQFYEKRIRQMPLAVLRRHKIVGVKYGDIPLNI